MNKMNYYIYKIIEPYLLYNNTFNNIFELSLICKKSFNNIQNYILYNQDDIKFYPNINYIIYYIYNIKIDNQFDFFNSSLIEESIKNDTLSNDNNYSLKLIQYKDIEQLYCIDNWGIYGQKEHYLNNKINLKRKCIKLNKVYIKSYYSVDALDQDPTCDSFYQYDNIKLYWDPDEAPESFYDECDDDYYTFNYSFEFLNRFNSIKRIKISTVPNEANMHLDKLNNIIIKGGNSIKKIDFTYHNTPYNFIINLLNSNNNKNIKSLSIRLGNFSINFNDQDINDDDDDDDNDQQVNTSDLIFKLFNDYINLKDNDNNIKKLILRKNVDLFTSPNNNNPILFLQSIHGYSNLKTLGLELFDLIDDNSFKLLSPLIDQSNINTLYCNWQSLNQFLLHCNVNSNIQVLKVGVDQYSSSNQLINNLNQLLLSFFKSNNNTLKYIYFYNDHFDQYLKDTIINLLNINNNNLIIKFINYNNNN